MRFDWLAARATGLRDDPGAARLVLLAGLGVFFAADDQTSVVAVLPKMIDGIGLPQDQFFRAAWIVNGYILGYVVAMPLMGRISDVFGHGRVFAAAMALFIAGSIWVALSSDLTMLSVARGAQAIGGGAVVPIAMAIVADAMPEGRRALGLGAMAAASEAGGLVGPIWGGGIAEVLGWRGVFWINVPMCLPIVISAWRARGVAGRAGLRDIDFGGAAALGVTLVCLTIALTDDPIEPRAAGQTALLFGGAAASLALFVARQATARSPLVPLSLMRRMPISAGLLTSGLVGGALIVAMVNVPLYTNVVQGGSAVEGGLNLMRLTVALPLGALIGGRISSRLGFGPTAALSVFLAGLGFIGMSFWEASPSFLEFTLPLLLAGFGLGLVIAPLSAAVVNEVDESQRATISSLLTVMRLIGALIGVALLTTRGLGGFYAAAGLIPLDDPAYADLVRGLTVEAFQDTFLATAIVCFATALPALMLGSPKRRKEWPG